MVYTYRLNTNTLSSVLDNANNTSGFNDFNKLGDDYTYDTNGNMITDKNKKINAIIYNHLNLPTKITFGATGNIVYIYNAAGQKLEKIVNSLLPTATVTTTNYLGGYQYQGVGTATPTLQFFPTAEGYVKNTVVNSTNNYSYVFNYTDHLGNVRLSYSDNITKDGIITSNEIVEENNYYPFGLKHKGYNANNLQPSYKYKFQGQERQDELGLNWDSFKWRNYDPAIARFMSVDPLTEKYVDWAPYVFSGNRVIDAREIEGLEPYVLFKTEQAAAENWGQQYNDNSIRETQEYGSTIGRSTDANGNVSYSYGPPAKGGNDGVSVSNPPKGTVLVADIHSHGAFEVGYKNNEFSKADKDGNKLIKIDGYLTTPNGTLQKYDPKTNKSVVVKTDLPSDPKDPTRKNQIPPTEKPKPKPLPSPWPKTKPIIPSIPIKT